VINSLVIRLAESDADVAEVRRLVHTYADAHAAIPGVKHMRADADGLPGAYVAPRGAIWIADSGSGAVACVALRPFDAETAEVKRMFVDSEWRGRGLGRALMEMVIAGARERGYKTLRLGTLHEMTVAQELYRSLGFVPIDRYRPDELTDTRFYELSL
jgi:putative acetyltransferase